MYLRDKVIFILGLNKFDDEIESTTFTIAKHLAQNNRVFFIENPFTWKDYILKNRSKKITLRKEFFGSNSNALINTTNANLKIVVTPPLISINWLPEGKVYRAFLKINEKIIHRRILQVIEKFNIRHYVFINSFNFYYPGIGRLLAPDLTVYHSVDPLVFSCDRKHGLVSEDRIVEQSDLVICTSKKLQSEKVKLNCNTYFIPNAADIKHSSKALEPGLILHDCLKNIQRPIVGYFGNIERRLDYAMLDKVTAANRNINFVFAGPVVEEHVPLWFYERANVHLTGPIPYDQMPQVLKGFDVAIIPFKKDEHSANIFPLKLFEYLGSGRPVVATDFNPDLADFTSAAVAYVSDAASFSQAINDGLLNDTKERKQNRLAIAAQNTWEKRVDELGDLINDYISLKQKNGKSIFGITNN